MQRLPRGTLFAVTLIVAGILLFLDNLGVLPMENIGAYWPLALVVYGLGAMNRCRTARTAVWSATLIVAGALLVLGNLGILHVTIGELWPLLLIAGGVLMLVERGRWSGYTEGWTHRKEWTRRLEHHWKTRERHGQRWDAVFFSIKQRVESQDFTGGEAAAVFGSVELDLTGAQLALEGTERRAVIEANAVFGAVEIVVPRNWRVLRDGTGVFGSFDDRTILIPVPGEDTATFSIHGAAVFGSVTIRN